MAVNGSQRQCRMAAPLRASVAPGSLLGRNALGARQLRVLARAGAVRGREVGDPGPAGADICAASGRPKTTAIAATHVAAALRTASVLACSCRAEHRATGRSVAGVFAAARWRRAVGACWRGPVGAWWWLAVSAFWHLGAAASGSLA
jgi:hypothetical protein